MRRQGKAAGWGVLGLVLAWAATPAAAVTMQAKETELAKVLETMAANGGARLTPHPEAAGETLSFATARMARTGAVRWLCRSCGLAVVEGEDGKACVGKPSAAKAEIRESKLGTLVQSEEEAEALVGFIRKVILAAFETREEREGGGRLPEAEVVFQEGQLKLLAPPVVRKEVAALLGAMARAKEQGDVETMTVKYGAYGLGYFRASTGAKPPALKGDASIELEGASAAEAAWTLTTQSKASFYIDAHDPALAKAELSLAAKDRPVGFVVKAMAEALDATVMPYDGAWLFVRKARKPLYDGLVVRVYYIAGGESLVTRMLTRPLSELETPDGLPYAIERVGDRILACVPPETHEQLQRLANWRRPGDGDVRRGWPGWGRRGGW